MAVDLGTVYAEIKLKTEQFTAALKDAEGSLSGFGTKMGSAAKFAAEAAVAGFTALGGAAAWGVKQFMDAEKVAAQTAAVIQSTGGVAGVTAEHVSDLANRLANLAGVEDEAVAAGENILLTFANIRNNDVAPVFDMATEAALNMSIALGEDMTSASMRMGKALNDPIQGVTALRRVGVQLSDAQEEQVKQFMAINDVASAQKVILDELNKEFGASAEMAGKTLAGSIGRLKKELGDLGEQIGGAIAPALTGLAGNFIDLVRNLDLSPINSLFQTFGQTLVSLRPGIEAVFGFLGETLAKLAPVLQQIVEKATPIIVNLVEQFTKSGIVDAVLKIVGALSDAFLSAVGNIAPSIVTIVSAILQVVTPIIQISDKAHIIQSLIYAWIASKIWTTIGGFTSGMQGLAGSLASAAPAAGGLVGSLQNLGPVCAAGAAAIAIVGNEAQKTKQALIEAEKAHTQFVETTKGSLQQSHEAAAAYQHYRDSLDTTSEKYYKLKAAAENAGLAAETAHQFAALAASGHKEAAGFLSNQYDTLLVKQSQVKQGSAEWNEIEKQKAEIVKLLDETFKNAIISTDVAVAKAHEAVENLKPIPANIVSMLRSTQEETRKAGLEGVGAYVQGMLEKKGVPADQARQIADQVKAGLSSQDPTIVANAKKAIEDMTWALVEKGQMTITEAEQLSKDVADALEASAEARQAGENTGASYADGLRQKLGDQFPRIAEMVKNNLKKMLSGFIIGGSEHDGGLIRHHGGPVYAHSGMYLAQDEVPIIARRGEYVVNDRVVSQLGVSFFEALNAGGKLFAGQGNHYHFHGDLVLPQVHDAKTFIDELTRMAARRTAATR